MQRRADNEERKRNTLRMFDQQMALVNQQRAVGLSRRGHRVRVELGWAVGMYGGQRWGIGVALQEDPF